MTSRSWIECSISVPPPALSTSLRQVDPYIPWIGKYWSSRRTSAIGLPYRPERDDLGRRAGRPARAAARARPGAARGSSSSPIRRQSAIVGASGFSQKTGRPASTAACDRREVAGGPGADPRDVDLVEQRPRASRPASAWFGSADRRGPLGVDVVGRGDVRVDEAGVGELAQRERVDGADVPAPDEPDSQHQRVLLLRVVAVVGTVGRGVGSVVGAPQAGTPAGAESAPLEERRRADRIAAEPLADRVERVLERAPVLAGAGGARRRTPAGPAPRPPSSSCWTDDAEQPDARTEVDGAEQVARGLADLGGEVGRASGSVCDRVIVRKSRVPHLELHGARRLRRARAAATATASAMRSTSRSSPSRSVRSVGERLLVADRLHLPVRLDRTVVAVPRQRVQMRRRPTLAERPDQRRLRAARARSPTVSHPVAVEPLARSPGRRPRAASTGSGCRNASSVPGSTTSRPSGFARSLASLARSFVVATPTDAVSPVSARMRAAQELRAISGPVPSEPPCTGHVEERLVERDRLDERRDVAQDRHHLRARLRVRVEARREEHRVRARPPGPGHRHRGMDAERPRLVARRRDDAPVAEPADDDRPAAQRWIVELLDRREERVEVEVQDRRRRRASAASMRRRSPS